MKFKSLQRASVGYNKKYLKLSQTSDNAWHKLGVIKTYTESFRWGKHKPFVYKVEFQWNLPNILNTVAKGRHITSSEDTIYILMNVCIDQFLCAITSSVCARE